MADDYRGLYSPNLPQGGGPVNHHQLRISKGDHMQCTVSIIPGNSYSRATNLRTVRTKRDSLLSEQVRDFLRFR